MGVLISRVMQIKLKVFVCLVQVVDDLQRAGISAVGRLLMLLLIVCRNKSPTNYAAHVYLCELGYLL